MQQHPAPAPAFGDPAPEEGLSLSRGDAAQGIRKQTYGDQITEFIKKSILNGEYEPGDKINEVDLAVRLRVSRAPVREALQYLTQTGLLVSIPQKGKFIASLTAKEIRDSYFTGGVLEGAAAAATVHLFNEADFASMGATLAAMAVCANNPGAMCRIAELDTAFHGHMFAKSDNELLRLLSRRSCQGISKFLLYRYWCKAFTPAEMHARHKVVLDAMISREARRIEDVVREHYIEAGRRMARYGSDGDSC